MKQPIEPFEPVEAFCGATIVSKVTWEQDFHLGQTQVLVMILDELEAWTEQAITCFGSYHLPCLDTHKQWLSLVNSGVRDMHGALKVGNKEIIQCGLGKDDPMLEALLTAINNHPGAEAIQDSEKNKALAQTLISLTDFWIVRIRQLLLRLLSQVTGNGEVFVTPNRKKCLWNQDF